MNKEEIKRLTKKRWLVLLSSCIVNLCIGALYAWSVFAGPMAQHLTELTGQTLTAADLAIVFSIGNSFGFITMIGGGFLNEKIGPKWLIFIGGVLFGLGFVICGFATSVTGLVIGYGLFSGLAMGLAYGCTISNSVKFFPDKAGLIGGIATASYGISSVIIPPIANAMISSFGVTKTFIYIGVFIVVVVGIFSQFIVKCPVGFMPEGYTPAAKTGGGKPAAVDKTWKEMLSTPVFYLMIIMLFFGASLGMMAISQASSIAQNMIGMTSAAAAVIVSVLALFNTCGRILAGIVSDKIGCIKTISGVFVVAMVSMLILFLSNNSVMFSIGICMVGICFGSFMGIYPSFTQGQFGQKNASVNYGIMFIGFNAAGFVGPLIIGKIYKASGEYRAAFIVALVFAVIGLLLSFFYQMYEKKGNRI